jgi:hypothetical protein
MKNRSLQVLIPIAATLGALSSSAHGAAAAQAPPSSLGQTPSVQKSAPPPSATGVTGPAAQGSATSAGASSAKVTQAQKHAALVKLLNSPDSTVVTVGGRTFSAGDIRKGIRTVASGFNRAPRVGGGRSVSVPGGAGALATQNKSLLAALQQSVGTSGGHAIVRSTAVSDINKPCPQRAPYIDEMKGSLTPGGMITFLGECLGSTQGQVRLYGDFPNGFLTLQVQLWTDGGIAAIVPADVSGVMDQQGRLEVVRADQLVSNDRKAAFVAARTTQQVPLQLVQLLTCTDFANDCANEAASHLSLDGDDGATGLRFGTDSWQVAVGNGWVLQNLQMTDQIGSTTTTGFNQGPPSSATFSVQWVGGVLSSTTTYQAFWDLVGTTETTYLAAYSFSATAVGPVGVSPDPNVKPPYSGHAVNTSISAQADAPKMPPSAVQNLNQQNQAANKPVWNTIIGTNSGAVNSTTRSKVPQVQGQPTSVQPGAPLQSQ